MNDLTVTIAGWAATDPRLHVTPGRAAFLSFRVATTSRYFDRANNRWMDRDTEWFTVHVFRDAATFISESVQKGQPVIVTGRLRTNTWDAESGPRTDLVIEAQAVGHDLTRGVAKFTRAVVEAPPAEPPADEPIDAESVEDEEEAKLELAESSA